MIHVMCDAVAYLVREPETVQRDQLSRLQTHEAVAKRVAGESRLTQCDIDEFIGELQRLGQNFKRSELQPDFFK